MNNKMNRKGGFFVPFFVVLTFLFLLALAVTMSIDENVDVRETVGYKGATIINTYNEGERMVYYLDRSTELANEEAWRELLSKGGTQECSTTSSLTQQGGYTLWTSCDTIDIGESYFNILSQKISKYVQGYDSVYTPVDSITILPNPYLSQEDRDLPRIAMTIAFQKFTKLKGVILQGENIIASFQPLRLFSEAQILEYEIKEPKVKLQTPDISIFTRLYSILSICKLKEDNVLRCTSDITSSFVDAQIEHSGSIIMIKIPVDLPLAIKKMEANQLIKVDKTNLLVAVDLSKSLPEIKTDINYLVTE